MSVKYNLFKLAVKAMGVKRRTARPPEDLVRLSREKQAKNPFRMPNDTGEFQYSDHLIDGFHCIRIHPCNAESKRAIMYVYGGGMMMPPAIRYLEYAKDMARLTQSDVWFPHYPLCSDATVLDAVRMVYAVWSEMTTAYAPGDIAFYGFSSGASLLLSALLYNAEQPEPLPTPALFIGIAPGGCPADETEQSRMLELDKTDIEVSASFMNSMRALMAKGNDDIPRYMIDGTGGHWEALPPTHLYYGSSEVLSAKAPAFERRLQEAGVPHTVTIRSGMCHCYCISPLFPEAKDDYNATIDLLRRALSCPTCTSCETGAENAAGIADTPSSTQLPGEPGAPRVSGTKSAKKSDVAFWDRTAFAYDFAMRKGDEGVAQAAAFAASFMESTDIVLDAACGTGAFACAIAHEVEFVAACDLSTKMLAQARAKVKKLGIDNIGFAASDITALDFDDDTFDAAIAGNVLHLLDDPQAAIDDLVRVVKPGGIIVAPNYFVNGKPADKRFVKAAETIGFPLKSDWGRKDFLAFLEQSGLEIIEERTFQGARPLCVAITRGRA